MQEILSGSLRAEQNTISCMTCFWNGILQKNSRTPSSGFFSINCSHLTRPMDDLMGSLMAQEQLSWESMFPCWGLCLMAAKCPVWLILWLLSSYPKLPSSSYRWNTSATIWARHLHVFHKPLGLHSVLFPFWFSHWEGWRKQKGEKKMQWFPLSQRRCFRKILISVL